MYFTTDDHGRQPHKKRVAKVDTGPMKNRRFVMEQRSDNALPLRCELCEAFSTILIRSVDEHMDTKTPAMIASSVSLYMMIL